MRARFNGSAFYMPCCHTCKVRPAPGTPWEKTPCKTCKLAEPSNHGRTHISIDAGDGEQHLGEVEAAILDARHLDEPTGGDDPDGIEARALFMAAEILHRFAMMTPHVRETVFLSFARPKATGRELADAADVTAQNISHHLRSAIQHVPELAECLPVSNDARYRARARLAIRGDQCPAITARDAAADKPAA